MQDREALRQTLSTPREELTPELVTSWREAYQGILFDIYPEASTAEDFLKKTAEQLPEVMPGTLDYGSLYERRLTLLSNSHEYLSKIPSFPSSLESASLTETEFFKGAALLAVVRDGEELLLGRLLQKSSNETTEESRLSRILQWHNVSSNRIEPFREVNDTTFYRMRNIAKNPTVDPSDGTLAADIVIIAGYFPSGEIVEDCIFLDGISSGDGFAHPKTMIIGTHVDFLAEQAASAIAQQIRVIIHEGEHLGQPGLLGLIRELGAYWKEIEGITAILDLPDDSFPPMTAPYYTTHLLSWLDTLRERTDTIISQRLAHLSSNPPQLKIEADHNIEALEEENNIGAKRIAFHSKPRRNVWGIPLPQSGIPKETT